MERLKHWSPFVLLAAPILFNLIFLFPETEITQYPLNDHVFHYAASLKMSEEWSLRAWMPMSMGYPVWTVYQPGSHIATAAVFRALWWADPQAVFAWLNYLLISLLPLGMYALARALGMSRLGAGMAAALSIAPASVGPLARGDIGYAGYVWRSWGLYAQLWGYSVGLPAVALVLRAVRLGNQRVLAGVALSAAIMCHFVVGWILVVSTILLLLLGWSGAPAIRDRMRRGAMILAVAAPIPCWFAVGIWRYRHWINNAHWGETWRDASFGAQAIVTALCNGTLLDFGRWPVLTFLVFAGASIAAWKARPLLAMACVWLAVFWGRATWGQLLDVIGVPGGLQGHRAQIGFEVFAVLLAAVGMEWAVSRIPGRYALCGVLMFGVALVPVYAERHAYLAQNAYWGHENASLIQAEKPSLDALVARLRELTSRHPGRVDAGRVRAWGAGFFVGRVSLSSYLTFLGLPTISYPYHVLGLAGDSMQVMNEWRQWDLQLFGVKWVVAPAGESVPAGLRQLDTFGRWVLYAVPDARMFDVVQVPHRWAGPKDAAFKAGETWLTDNLRWWGQYIRLDVGGKPSTLTVGSPIPAPDQRLRPPFGRIVSEYMDGKTIRATVLVLSDAWVRVSVAYHPLIRARVDGVNTATIMVTPGFLAFPVGKGRHEITLHL